MELYLLSSMSFLSIQTEPDYASLIISRFSTELTLEKHRACKLLARHHSNLNTAPLHICSNNVQVFLLKKYHPVYKQMPGTIFVI